MTAPLQKQQKEKTKVVVRKLPPALSEEQFKAALDKVLDPSKYNWLSYFPGKLSVKRVVFSRAYVNFNWEEDVFDFKAKFDGHLFVSSRGNQYRCAVEYAPFQKVPSTEAKKHPLQGTLEKDPDYIEFLRLYEAGEEPLPSAAAQRAAAERAGGGAAGSASDAPQSRLLAYLEAKYAEGGRLGSNRGKKGRQPQAGTVVLLKGAPEQRAKDNKPSKAKEGSKASAPAATPGKDSSAPAAAAASPAAAGKGKGSSRAGGNKPADGPAATTASAEPHRHDAAAGKAAVSKPDRPASSSKPAASSSSSGKRGSGKDAHAAAADAAVAAALHPAADAGGASGLGKGGAGKAAAGGSRGHSGRSGGRADGGVAAAPLVEKPPAAEAPKALLTKGGKKDTGAVSSSSSTAPAPAAPAGAFASTGAAPQPVTPAAGGKGNKPSGDSIRQPSARGQRGGTQAAAEPQPAAAAAAGRGSSATIKPSGSSAPPAKTVARGSEAHAAMPAKGALPGAAVATPAPAGASGPSNDTPGGATSPAAAAAVPGRKVRAGFQAYVPGALRNRQGTGGGGGEG